MKKYSVGIFLTLIVLFSVALRAPGLYEYLGWDEGRSAWVASQMLEGHAPYAQIKNDREPMTYMLYALSFIMLGQDSFAVRLMGIIWVLASLLMIFLMGKSLGGPAGGLAAAFFFGMSMGGLDTSGMRTNTEVFMTLPSVIAYFMALLAVRKDSRSYLLAAGIAVGFNFSLKVNAVFDLAGIMTFVALRQDLNSSLKDRYGRLIKACGLLLLGFVLGVMPSAAYLAYKGALAEAWRQLFLFRFQLAGEAVSNSGGVWARLAANWGPALKAEIGMAVAVIAGLVVILKNRRRDEIVLVIWALFSFAAISFNGWFGVRYLPFVLPALSLMAGYGIQAFVLRRPLGKGLSMVVLAVFIVCSTAIFFNAHPNKEYYEEFSKNFIKWKSGDINEHDFHKAMQADVTDFYEAGRYVHDNTKPSDFVFFWTNSGEFLWSAGRTPSSWYMSPLAAGDLRELEKKQKDIVYDDVKRNRPKYFVVREGTMRFTLDVRQSTDELDKFTELKEFLDKNYELDRIFGRVMVYRYVGGESGGPRARSKVFFPERMSPSVGHLSGLVWVMYANGSMRADFVMPSRDDTTVTLRAKGTPSGGIYPLCDLLVDGKKVAAFSIDSGSMKEFKATVRLDKGRHGLELRYINDDVGISPGQDRNLYVDWITLRYSPKNMFN